MVNIRSGFLICSDQCVFIVQRAPFALREYLENITLLIVSQH